MIGTTTVMVTRYGESRQTQKVVFDADFVLGNKVDMVVDGVPIAQVAFATTHAAALAAVAAAIQDMSTVESAVATGAREITVAAAYAGVEVLISGIEVTGGASQASGSITGKAGGYVDGVYQPGTVTTFSAVMSVQPAGGKELLKLPEGQRTKTVMKGYTETALYTADQAASKKADVVTYEGALFEVQKVEPWGGNLSHYKVLMVGVNP